jgi:hypothetical protein
MRPTDGGFDIWPFAVVGFIAVLVVVSITPVARLNSEPPERFVQFGVHSGKPDEALAGRYWKTCVKVIQWKYRHTDALPLAPPADFQPADDSGGFREQNAAVRWAYWRSFRGEWLKQENWHTSYTVDVTWVWRNLQWVWKGTTDFFRLHG